MNEQIEKLINQAWELANKEVSDEDWHTYVHEKIFEIKFAELIIRECVDQVEQAKKSPFVSLDDAKRMAHFVDVTTKKIQKHFGVE